MNVSSPIDFAFDRKRLADIAESMRESYRQASPFPHAVLDGLLPDAVLDQVLAEFPDPSERWRSFDDSHQKKFGATAGEADLGPLTRNVLAEFNGAAFVDFLQVLTGIDEPLIPDPYYKGGGLHQVPRGGYLKVHADFNVHPLFGLDRRVNVLLYLNRGWQPEWGGQLELWDTTMTRPERRIEPDFNRMVVFSITDIAFHGHPDALKCPDDRARRSLAFYYYSNGRPAEEQSERHTTLFQRRPDGSDS
jgi:hypothetical protein